MIIREIFSDASGGLSLNRVITAFVVVVVMINWSLACYAKGELVSIGDDNLMLVLGAIAGKTIQRGLEK